MTYINDDDVGIYEVPDVNHSGLEPHDIGTSRLIDPADLTDAPLRARGLPAVLYEYRGAGHMKIVNGKLKRDADGGDLLIPHSTAEELIRDLPQGRRSDSLMLRLLAAPAKLSAPEVIAVCHARLRAEEDSLPVELRDIALKMEMAAAAKIQALLIDRLCVGFAPHLHNSFKRSAIWAPQELAEVEFYRSLRDGISCTSVIVAIALTEYTKVDNQVTLEYQLGSGIWDMTVPTGHRRSLRACENAADAWTKRKFVLGEQFALLQERLRYLGEFLIKKDKE